MKHFIKMMTPLALAVILFSSCNESTVKSEEKTEINQMDSTAKAVKDSTDRLEDATEKVEESLEKLEKELSDTTD